MDLRRTRRQWTRLGASDPLWGVLSDPHKKGQRWDPEDFLRDGRGEIDEVLEQLRLLGLTPKPPVLDVGCGAGRLTQALAARVGEATGVDMSAGMIRKAEELNLLGDRCRFVNVSGEGLDEFPDSSFGMVYCVLALQHMPTQTAERYMSDFCRVLAPNGILVFQVPTGKARGREALWTRLVFALKKPWRSMDIHYVPRNRIRALLAAGGCSTVRESSDWRAGRGWYSATFWVTKSSP